MSLRIATILARAGSKGLPDKNVRPFLGEPMLALSVRQALRTRIFDCVAVSSDSEAYLDIARDAGAQVLVRRPQEMANDSATKLPGIRHAVEIAEATLGERFSVVADLAVTSPLRGDQDVVGAVRLLEESAAPLVLSASIAKDNPYFNMLETSETDRYALCKEPSERVSARQAAPTVYALNGAVYVWRRRELAQPNDRVVRPMLELYLMPEERSLDVDSTVDFQIAEMMAQKLRGEAHD
ncbi:acylneuraminate cytidylyltransferase family protein [Tropicimonas aquimaris]|uniref:Cytidylyltransferase domain-containing protein n=1 Tax=Tropicimonas aquimaris TaxID=914152 RepID=A0ABW3IYH2_9RHOB